jgi:hypothetical protein
MQRAVCESCGARQPLDWAPSDLCVACGAAVRRELRCAWCADWSPAGRYCRLCGCELVEEALYGAARMLMRAGVDRFTLAQRLREMDADLQANLSRIYDSQRAVVMRRVDEMRLCEAYLLQRGYADDLEDHLIRLLPASKEDLDAFASGPRGPFLNCPECLPEIARQSPSKTSRTLASIALVRLGRFDEDDFAAVVAGLQGEQAVAVESALAIAHWRIRLYACAGVTPRPVWWRGFSFSILVRAARTVRLDSPLGPWAAAAVALGLFWDRAGTIGGPDPIPLTDQEAAEELRAPLLDGIGSSDPDLRFTCAMALAETPIIARELHSPDTGKSDVVRRFLAKTKSLAIGSLLADGPRDLQAEILQNLSPPLPQALVAPVLSAVERGAAGDRHLVVWLLESNLTEQVVARVVGLALKERDPRLFTELLGTKTLPDRQGVIRTAIGAGLLPELGEVLSQDPFDLDFSDTEFLLRACESDPRAFQTSMTVALWQIERGPKSLLHLGRFLARAAFGPYPMDLRLRAYELLTHHRLKPLLDWLKPPIASRLFGGIKGFVDAIVSLAAAGAAEKLCYSVISDVYGGWDRLVPAIAEDPARLDEFLRAVHHCAKRDSFPYLAAHTRVLTEAAPVFPERMFPLLFDLLSDADLIRKCDEVSLYTLHSYEKLRIPLQENLSLASAFVEVLAGHLKPGGQMDYTELRLMDLLARMVSDFPSCRARVAEKLAPMIEDLESQANEVKHLAELLLPPPELPVERAVPEPRSLEALDNEVLLPDQPLTTLADYVAFIREAASATDPLQVAAQHNLSLEQYMDCVRAWCDLISRREDVAMRYGLLLQDTTAG